MVSYKVKGLLTTQTPWISVQKKETYVYPEPGYVRPQPIFTDLMQTRNLVTELYNA